MQKKGVFNTFRIIILAVLMLTAVSVGAVFIFSEAQTAADAPANAGTLNWANFDFSGLPYASNGDGKFDKFVDCTNPMFSSICAPTWDLRSTWVTMDSNFIAWKITGKNFSNATFCGGSATLALEIEFDSDGNASTGCRGASSDPCYPGSDYHINVNSTGNGTLTIFNSTSLSGACPAGNCFNTSTNVTVFVNISKTNGVCDSDPSTIRVAINKSQLVWEVLTYGVVSKQTFPVDLIGANRQEFDNVGFGGGNFFEKEGNGSFMFREGGCGSFTNQSYCSSGALNGNFSCVWESDFNHCRPNFQDTGTYGCTDFCGSCTTQNDCNTGARSTCKWIGNNGPCVENFANFRQGGNCDNNCKDCFNQNICLNSRVSGGCDWLNDTVTRSSFCAEKGTTIKGCGPNTEATSCSNCNATGCISVANGGVCAWENTSKFCYFNIPNSEYSCFDGADNNGNGLADCADPACSSDKYCGGGEFDKKMLTDRNFVTTMKQFGICTQTSSGLQCNKEQAMLFDSARGMDEKPGPPQKLKDDTDSGTEPPASHSWLNILGFGFKDMGKSIGMGMMLQNGAASAVCGTYGNGTGIYYYYIDTDSSTSTGCWEIINNTNTTGIEYKFVYNVSMTANGSSSVEKRFAYRCLSQNTSDFGLYPAKLSTPVNPFQPTLAPLCMFGAAIIVVPLTDIGNPSTAMTYHLATVDNLSASPALANDTIFNATYTPGAVDFIPPDCEKNPFACGTAFAKMGGGRFTPFEDCAPGSGDEDQDGTADCSDTDCIQAPWCSSNRASLIANDKTAPRVLTNIVETFDAFAMLRQSANEPSNLSVEFYNTTSACTTSLVNLTSVTAGGGVFEFDRYKPWNSINFDNKTISSLAPLKASTIFYYRTKNCDVSGNCAVSACLNFTTKGSGSTNFNFGLLFDPQGGSQMSGLNLTYFNGSEYVHFSVRNISYITNTTMRFENRNASFNGSIRPWNIEFEGVSIAKATSINMTDMMIVAQVNESNAAKPTATRMLVGMNGTRWQEMAQVLGISAIVVNISQRGNRIIKCDINGSGCIDVTSNVTILKRGINYTTIRVPTYGLGGFSAYGVNDTGVELKSDRTAYQCYPSCTIYWNVTNYQSNYSQIFNLTVIINDTSAKATYNISYLNLSDPGLGQWVNLSTNNQTNITNYNFTIVDAGRLNYTVHQFKIQASMTMALAERITFNITLNNGSGFIQSWTDTAWLDNINITAPEDNNQTTDTNPRIYFTLYSLNTTTQSCTLRINGTTYVNGSVINATNTTFTVNQTLLNGSHTYNISCTNSNTGETGNSTVRTLRERDTTNPRFTSAFSASTTSSTATITWTTSEPANTTFSRGTSSTSFNTNHTETEFPTSHSIAMTGLTASTTYYFNVTACDPLSNCNTTGPNSFTTSAAPSSSSSSGGGSSGGGGGGAAASLDKVSRQWSNLPSGSNIMNIVKASIAVRKITIETTNPADNAEITVIKLNATPSSGAAPGTTYQYLQIDTTNFGSAGLKSATFEFNVEKKWLTSNNIVRDKIALYRYSSSKWNELTTTITGEDTLNINYKAESPGFSNFAIAGKSGTTVTTTNNNTTTTQQNVTTTGTTTNQTTTENQTIPTGNETGKPSLMPTLDKIFGIPLVNAIAIAIIGLAVIGVFIYFISKKAANK